MSQELLRSPAVHDVKFRHNWAKAHPYCQCCGVETSDATASMPFGLQVHHLIKFKRSDESCNLLKLCHRCHQLAELHQIRVAGKLLPKLTAGVCLMIKKTREPFDWQPMRLQHLFYRCLPDLEKIPDIFEKEYRQRQPGDIDHFFNGY